MIRILLWLLIFVLVICLVYWIVGILAIPFPARQIVLVIVSLVLLIALLNRIGVNL